MNYVILLIIAFVISFIAAWLQVPIMITFAIIFLIVFPSLLFSKFYPLLWTKSIDKTERYIKKNLKDPIVHLYYALSNELDDEVEIAMKKILRKYKDQKKQAIFLTIEALYRKDIATAEENVEHIQPEPYKQYYITAIAIERGNIDKATKQIEKIKIAWMKDALYCELEYKLGNIEIAQKYAHEAIKKTRGIQKYQLFKHYEKKNLIA